MCHVLGSGGWGGRSISIKYKIRRISLASHALAAPLRSSVTRQQTESMVKPGEICPAAGYWKAACGIIVTKCLILQDSFCCCFAWRLLWRAESPRGGDGQGSWKCPSQGKIKGEKGGRALEAASRWAHYSIASQAARTELDWVEPFILKSGFSQSILI